ncbi:MAG: MEDS domain-containing protein, partial [Spirochaetales bacterium]|nr:MEDS domain-containing protein [Spirochaetales bacterium]MCF7939061.1 MEDS domain-containing protein [Spirochaetales bacterium]
MAGTIFQSIRELNAGDHLCCIYQTDEEHRRLISEYVRLGLEEKQKNLFIIDTDTAQTVIESLESIGIDAKAHQNSGRLSFLSRQERFTSGGQFVPEAMVELIRSETRKALEEGFSALRITNEMAWILPEPTDPEQLLEYENKLNHFISGQPCIALGLYDKRYFSPSILMNVLRTHPEAVIGTEVFENFYYLPPEKLLGDKPSVSELDLWINNLREYSTAHQALQDSEERYRNLYNSLRDAILVADTERTIIHCNQAFTDLFGYTLEEVRGKKTQYVYSNDGEFQELGERLQRTDEEEFQYTIHYRKKDGSTFPGETKIFAFKDSRNTTTGYIGMIRDVTEQLRMENELKREQRIVEAILETSGALILSIDSEGTIERANQSCEEITGY